MNAPSPDPPGEPALRCFVALPLPEQMTTHLRHRVERTRRVILDRSVRFTDPARWHITLAFLAGVPPRRVPGLREQLTAAVASLPAAPELRLAGSGRFGTTAAWVGIRQVDDETGEWLESTANTVRHACRRAGASPDRGPWRAHLTVARRHRGSAAQVRAGLSAVAAELGDYAGPPWRPAQIVLYQSVLGPRPVHSPLLSLPVIRASP